MTENDGVPGLSGAQRLEADSRAGRRKVRKIARPSEITGKPGFSQISIQVPRDVMASLDDFAAVSGVNRQFLIREALAMYAGLLDGGLRVYEVPGVKRERAA